MAHDPDDAPKPLVTEDPALDSLEARLAAAKQKEVERLSKEHSPMADGRGMGMVIASTMLGYPLGGIIVGYGLDRLLGTLPWLTIVLMFLAFAGACLHVVRTYNNRVQ